MRDPKTVFTAEWSAAVFPPERTEKFFEAIFGDPEEGAYNIELAFVNADGRRLEFAFNLHQRGGECLACNFTTGLPKVFDRHPIIDARGIAERVAGDLGRKLAWWEIGKTRQHSNALHSVPFFILVE